ncbi:MAG TPA: Maf family protein [Tepidisphaeraceae bacterium]|jgi:septum formation protein
MTDPFRLILASASPRRQQLLAEAGFEFEVNPSDVDEQSIGAGLGAGDLAERLAEMKADAVSRQLPNDVILAADTVVAYLDRVLGKPRDAKDAERMLRVLSGTAHSVITGVAVYRRSIGHFRHTRVLSAVHMRELTDNEIHAYVQSKQWEGKAGGYGIQDPDPFVTRVSGSQTNIVGLPIELVTEMLAEVDIRLGTWL